MLVVVNAHDTICVLDRFNVWVRDRQRHQEKREGVKGQRRGRSSEERGQSELMKHFLT